MSNILIINLKRFGDIYTTAHLINSIQQKNPHANISMLVFEEFKRAAVNLKGLKNLYTIDRKQILAYKQNALFSDGFSLDLFANQVQELGKKNWDQIINYSNETVGAYLTSYLKNKNGQAVGVHFSNENIAKTASDWDIVFNDVLTSYKHTPIHFVDCYHRMTDTEVKRGGEKLLTNTKHNESAFKNINYLRQSKANGENPVRIVGLQLMTSVKEKNISYETLKDLVQLYLDSKEFYPILLIAPYDEERALASKLNNEFKNTLVLVEADLQALTSVLLNIDIVVTPDTVTKHIADLTETPTVEVSLGAAPFLKQGSYNPESLILTPIINQRSFFEKEVKASKELQEINKNVLAEDIFISTKYLFRPNSTELNFSDDVTLYRPQVDQMGIRYTAIGGHFHAQTEISRLMSRYYLANLFDLNRDLSILAETLTFENKAINNWLNIEKNEITLITKELLGSLRSLLQIPENKKKSADFVRSLEKLLTYCDSDSLVAVATLIFRSKIESLKKQELSKNVKEIEALLYELKADIQKAFKCLKELEQALSKNLGTEDRVSINRGQASV